MPPQDDKTFKLYLSANEKAIGSALVQEFEGKERVVYFVSRSLLNAEKDIRWWKGYACAYICLA
jgi:hypothetical protein